MLVVGSTFFLTRLFGDISNLIVDREAALSSLIFSAPHEIRGGDDLEGSQLMGRLDSLRYSLVDDPKVPGQYARKGSEIVIYLRGYQQGSVRQDAALVRLKIERGRIAAVSGAGMQGAMLEPEAIGRLAPGAPAERVEVRLDEQKPYLIDGLLATEDQYFYWHPGINPVRILKAAIADLQAGRLVQGASTLTQQLARTYLERRERTFARKLYELAVAIVLEARLSKREILESYINDVSMGAYAGTPIHGMPQAARYFFDKDLSQVTPGEAATLIGMVQAPTLYNPRRHREASTERRDAVLAVMHRNGVIDEQVYAQAVSTPIELGEAPVLRRAPHFVDYVLAALATVPGVGEERAGLRVYTPLDAAVQDTAAHAVVGNLERLEKSYKSLRRSGKQPKLESAAVVLDAHSGAIRALIGGRSYAESQFDRASWALRQPGSAFKPIVYLAAMDPERSPLSPPLTLATILPDEPMSFGGWTPENHERNFRMRVTALTALSDSLNIPAAYIGSRVGPETIVRTAHDLGIAQDLQPLLPIAIGAEETTLLDLTSAYQVIANAGARSPAYSIEAVVDARGNEVYRHEVETRRIVDPAVAYLVTSALQAVMKSGTGASAAQLGLKIPAAGKTGTTQDYKDAYFVGYTPDLVCGVWLGFDSPQSIGLTGGQAALPAWVKIMQRSAASGARDFAAPAGIVTAKIDPVSGGLATPWCDKQLSLPFLEGTVPDQECPVHGGEDFLAASDSAWGGWESSGAAPPPADEPPREPRKNVFRKLGGFFGNLFRRGER
ncbi:MAG TPA: transglycosylase domain-containing protein [Candidatus Binatia bacterium]|nr:transglycosylase domain-containing protein [Candidatus Binatia bacterium]